MAERTLISYAQNGEDVVLWRALGHIRGGIYVDVGGWDPDQDSVTRAFYERGWKGIDIEPVPDLAEKFRQRRPGDEVVEAVITDEQGDELVLHRFGATGLSTLSDEYAEQHAGAGLEREDIRVRTRTLDDVLETSQVVDNTIHFLKIDVEGAEAAVVASVDLERWRPWVLVIEATSPNSSVPTHHAWESRVLAAGYAHALFDGLSRYYVSSDHPELLEPLGYPACVLDDFVTAEEVQRATDLRMLGDELRIAQDNAQHWRGQAVTYWANAMAKAQASDDAARAAVGEVQKLRTQLDTARDKLTKARTERDRLRGRVEKLQERVERLRGRLESGANPPEPERSSGSLLRSAAKRVIGS